MALNLHPSNKWGKLLQSKDGREDSTINTDIGGIIITYAKEVMFSSLFVCS